MDRREGMPLSGTAYYMQRGMPGSGPGSGSNPNLSFQPTIGVSSSMASGFPMETSSSGISPHGVNVGVPSAVPAGEPVRRKRGRPRKYGPEGTVSLGLSPTSSSASPLSVSPSQKRGRGRPPGSGRKQQLASLGGLLSGSAGMGFTPHVITIAVGEDITTKIMSFSQQGPRAVCILSANGSVSTVTLRQPSSGGAVTYEGRFEILCLSGSYLITDSGGTRSRSGGLSISLASPDGRVIGGGVGGVLIAASPIQVIVGSFVWGSGSKSKNKSGGGSEASGDMDRRATESPVIPATTSPGQNLTSPTTSLGAWPISRSMDMQNAHVDIDLMRE